MDYQLLFKTRALMREKTGYLKFVNDAHPELEEGEVFLCNANEMLWQTIDFKSKRRGKVAYENRGTEIKDKTIFPVFVKKSAVLRRGIKL